MCKLWLTSEWCSDIDGVLGLLRSLRLSSADPDPSVALTVKKNSFKKKDTTRVQYLSV